MLYILYHSHLHKFVATRKTQDDLLTPISELSRYGMAVNMMSCVLAPRFLAMYVGSHCMMM